MRIAVDGLVNGEAPRGAAGVLEVVEAERKRINRSTAAAIKAIEVERDRELKTLAQAAAVLGEKEGEGSESSKEASRREPRRRRRVRENPIEAARERREATYRYISEKGGEVSTAEIRSALRMTTSSPAGALKRLCEEGRIKRTGIGSGTRYTAVAEGSKESRDGERDGTVHGRILALVEDRGSVAPEEIGQALHISPEEVQQQCGALIREEEIRMARLNGQSVYVINGGVAA
jgi:Mn-dependent DtxR family transcriptional regulator